MKKFKILTSLALALGLVATPVVAEEPVVVSDFASLKAALKTNGDFKLGADITLGGTCGVSTELVATLDLAGYKIIGSDAAYLYSNKQGSFTITDSVGTGAIEGHVRSGLDSSLTLKGVTLDSTKVSTAPGSTGNSTLTLEDCKVVSNDNGIVAVGNSTTVIKNSTVEGTGFAACTNGSVENRGATLTIENSDLSSSNGVAVYVPGGTVTITGGTITGATGIFQRGGTLTVSGTTVTGNGSVSTFNGFGKDGCDATGDALVVANDASESGYTEPSTTITEGTKLISTNGKAATTMTNPAKTLEKVTHFVELGAVMVSGTALTEDEIEEVVVEGATLDKNNIVVVETADITEPDSSVKPAEGVSEEVANTVAKEANVDVDADSVKEMIEKLEGTNADGDVTYPCGDGNLTVPEIIANTDTTSLSGDLKVEIAPEVTISIEGYSEEDLSLELDITLFAKTYVVGKDGNGDEKKVLAGEKEVTVGNDNDVTVKLTIPEALSKAPNLRVKHTHGDETEIITPEVSGNVIKFTLKGLSPVTVYSAEATPVNAAVSILYNNFKVNMKVGEKSHPAFMSNVSADAFKGVKLSLNKDGSDAIEATVENGGLDKDVTGFVSADLFRVQFTDDFIGNLKVGKWYAFVEYEENGEKKLSSVNENAYINVTEANAGGQGVWDDGSPFTHNANGDVLDRWGNVIWKAPSGYRLVNTGVAE